ncbi:hypothetical protein [Mycolicibacterium sphagni]|uniref:hypothetical protein n=1 Tax=Mycolicibacterium sphagni TaxID=1786 RepID=UPI0021F38BF0|nr:hypothetical protein [Mycolicibacterium sphagni]MCV7176140.1 hypothetical protein [Mycolicibacterium sphagni]
MSTHEFDEQAYQDYWRVLYPTCADPDSNAYWLARMKTAEMCRGLFRERQWVRDKWIAAGPSRGPEECHVTAVVTYDASPVRSQTVKVCLACLWISGDRDAQHGEAEYSPAAKLEESIILDLVYTPSAHFGVVFAERDVARRTAQVWHAVQDSTTWGAFRTAMPPADWEEAISRRGDDIPPDDNPFTPDDVKWGTDGCYLGPWLPDEEVDWFPEDLIDRYRGTVDGDNLSNYQLFLPGDAADEIAEELRARGHRVEKTAAGDLNYWLSSTYDDGGLFQKSTMQEDYFETRMSTPDGVEVPPQRYGALQGAWAHVRGLGKGVYGSIWYRGEREDAPAEYVRFNRDGTRFDVLHEDGSHCPLCRVIPDGIEPGGIGIFTLWFETPDGEWVPYDFGFGWDGGHSADFQCVRSDNKMPEAPDCTGQITWSNRHDDADDEEEFDNLGDDLQITYTSLSPTGVASGAAVIEGAAVINSTNRDSWAKAAQDLFTYLNGQGLI